MRKPKSIAKLAHELLLIQDDMMDAMGTADEEYIASGRITIKMQAVLVRFQDWARRVMEWRNESGK